MDRWNWNDSYPHGKEQRLDKRCVTSKALRVPMSPRGKTDRTWQRSRRKHMGVYRGNKCTCHACRVQKVIELCTELDIPILTPEEARAIGLDVEVSDEAND